MRIIEKLQHSWVTVPPQVHKRIVAIISVLLFCNVFVWLYAIFASHTHPLILGLVALAYGLGLRHAVDADHIAAIDNTTRKLMLDGKRPVAVGLFFSLGHSTIVTLLSIIVAFSSSFITHSLPTLQSTGTIIGTAVSGFFLLLIGFINLVAFLDILRVFRGVTKNKTYLKQVTHNHLHTQGFLTRIFKPVLKTVSSSWHMYFIGFLFGLGFDTASEVGLLSISAASGATGISFWEILLLPLAFTAGMALIDTIDGILMLGAYGWAYIKPVRKLYYNLNITFISVIIALFIGSVEVIQLFTAKFNIHNSFFQWISRLDLNKLGYMVIAIFILSWAISLSIYKMKRYDQLT